MKNCIPFLYFKVTPRAFFFSLLYLHEAFVYLLGPFTCHFILSLSASFQLQPMNQLQSVIFFKKNSVLGIMKCMKDIFIVIYALSHQGRS